MTEKSRNHEASAGVPSLTAKKAALRKFVALSDIQLQALIDRIAPDDRNRKVLQANLEQQSNLMKSQIDKVTTIEEADQLYDRFEKEFK
ncbi:hypothetical protein MOO44_04665 [Nicoliella spurrieriana]|uniref:Uncharacterized protein n=1 Tax=Nicoliella spurrieriana TaxID=2925830 RepID=A0A976X6K8_9LACO|nr:hypothetical protein [Nicoliella spurrieriana]UQS87451.1 hypothetical protein MOO44_04665 [Nicoliella spurrieriana]